jgi:hypothetical protein
VTSVHPLTPATTLQHHWEASCSHGEQNRVSFERSGLSKNNRMSAFMRMAHLPSGCIASAMRATPPLQRMFLGRGAAATGARPYTHETPKDPNVMYATTVLSVRKNGKVVIIGDGQVRVRQQPTLCTRCLMQDAEASSQLLARRQRRNFRG